MSIPMKRAFILDVGSASVRLIIAGIDAEGRLQILFNKGIVSNLRKAMDSSNVLDLRKAAATLTAVENLLDQAKAFHWEEGACLCTQTLRQAINSAEFLERLKIVSGVTPEILSPSREGELAGMGSRDLLKDGDILIDFGGGSTELIDIDKCGTIHVVSYPIGAGVDIQIIDEVTNGFNGLRKAAQRMWMEHLGERLKVKYSGAVILGGTMTTLGAVGAGIQVYIPGDLHGLVMSVETILDTTRRLWALSDDARGKIHGMEPGREGIIVNGGVLLSMLLEILNIQEIRISERGIRFGRLQELLQADF
ncbi:hypothetical protein JW823_02135 [bacterium]|nr:hypothetical protein [candidate division CSSED10-310 bacterium]